MEKVTYHELRLINACKRRREYPLHLRSADSHPKQLSAIQKAILSDVLSERMESGEIPDRLHELLKEMPFRSKKGKELLESDISKRLYRCADTINGRKNAPNYWSVLTDLPDTTVILPGSTETLSVAGVKPDLVVRSHVAGIPKITAYHIRIGAPKKPGGTKYRAKDAAQDLQVLALLEYARLFAEQLLLTGGEAYIEAGFLFLRKSTDKAPNPRDKEWYFDPDLFYDDNGKETDNVATVQKAIRIGQSKDVLKVKEITAVIDRYLEGIPAEECPEENCKDCEYYDVCYYTHSPLKLEENKAPTALSLIRLSGIQEQIQNFQTGYAVVNAVPGAGKTLVLVLRIINLLNLGVKPEEIAIITFTNAGAEVFKERISLYNDELGYGEPVDKMIATTFNGFGQSILEKEYRAMGFEKVPKVIDPIERSGIIAKLLNEKPVEGLDYRNFTTDMKTCKGALAVASECFRLMKQYGWTQFDADKISARMGRFCSREAAQGLACLFDEYCSYLKKEGLVEYADQEVLLLEMLGKDPYYFDSLGVKHILVDECQDTSENQFRILKYLTQTTSFESLMIVGDDSQSIYGFRDTTPRYFLSFEETMGLLPGTAAVFTMDENYRSTPEIISFANDLITLNKCRVDKTIVAVKGSGKPVSIKGFASANEEYRWIADSIAQQISSGRKPEEIAVIASTKTELLKVADILTSEDIPSVLLTPEKYLENSRVRAALALAGVFRDENTHDAMIYFNASLSGDLFLFGKEQMEIGIDRVIEDVKSYKALPEKECMENFFRMLDFLDEDDEIYQSFEDFLRRHASMNAILSYCEDFSAYGEKAEKRREHNYPGVVLTTAHSSKGMEFPVVYNTVTKYDLKELRPGDDIEEKRRLLFVSVTRAKEELYITGKYIAYGGKKDPHFNRFLMESFEIVGEAREPYEILCEIEEKNVK